MLVPTNPKTQSGGNIMLLAMVMVVGAILLARYTSGWPAMFLAAVIGIAAIFIGIKGAARSYAGTIQAKSKQPDDEGGR